MIQKQENIKKEMAFLIEKRDKIDQRLLKLRGDFNCLQMKIESVGLNPDLPSTPNEPSIEAQKKVENYLSNGGLTP
jgi:hypothetical protein